MTTATDSPTDGRSLGAGAQAAVGVYVAAISVGIASLAAAAAAASIETALSLVPTIFTAGLVVGALAAWARPGVVAPFGASRWRTVALCPPGIGLGIATGTLAAIDGVPDLRLLAPAGVGAAGTVVIGALLAQIAHDRYVETAIAGDPEAVFAAIESARAGSVRVPEASPRRR
ncbi:hypothetical protein [Halosolutus gelatinilyticus]|uniref:hypothetical protein n=1 Tax=Halosolutus gelatinilyticus TaxID=2931975 RepID=UPI001FF6AC3C|nr:hypothetical protein [Halosolutus gelatinilyticus]